ncbi:Endocytosis regulator [Amphichorda felina]
MPGRVATFLRNPSGNISHIKSMKAAVNRSLHGSPDVSDSEDGDHHNHHHHHHHLAVKMPDLADAFKNHRRLSLPFIKKDSQCPVVGLVCNVESPPIIFHGSPEESTGALISGTLVLDIKEDVVEIDSFHAALNIHITHKRPFQNHCAECANQYTELQSWNFLAHSTILHRGRHVFPFSTLLPGHLPASMSSSLLAIAYEFKAEVAVAAHCLPHPSSPSTAKFEHVFPVKRSLPRSETPHHSIRLFPPTNIKSSVYYDTVIHPTGSNKVTLKLDGLMNHNTKTKTLDIWRLKKITWKLEETTKTVAPACERHSPAAQTVEAGRAEDGTPATRKGMARTEVRLLGEKHLHDGWKSDYSGADGSVDMEFDYMVNQRCRKGQLKYAADTKSRDGTEVTHSLLIELVVSKEFAPEGRPGSAAQTGTGRILRMHFNVVMTEHSGLGVSWDEEAPPVYQDVPPSPPRYQLPEPPIEYEDLETLDARRLSGEPPSRRASGSD